MPTNRQALLPRDKSGNPVEAFGGFPGYGHLCRVADKRTHRLALESIRPGGSITLKEALAAAYVQGLLDAVISTNE